MRTYSQSTMAMTQGNPAGDARKSQHLRRLLLGGEYFLAAVLSSSLLKLLLVQGLRRVALSQAGGRGAADRDYDPALRDYDERAFREFDGNHAALFIVLSDPPLFGASGVGALVCGRQRESVRSRVGMRDVLVQICLQCVALLWCARQSRRHAT